MLGRDLPDGADPAAVAAAVDHYFVGVEICGSRFLDRTLAGITGGLADGMSALAYCRSTTARALGNAIDGLEVEVTFAGAQLYRAPAKHGFVTVLASLAAYAKSPRPGIIRSRPAPSSPPARSVVSCRPPARDMSWPGWAARPSNSTLSEDHPMQPSRDISRLLEIMAALRNPDGGCPWDLDQDFMSIRNYTIEEAYEVADAIERNDFDDLREELGEFAAAAVFHAQMAAEASRFDFGDVVQAITEKLIRRHPHVFGEQAARDAGGAKARWDDVKEDERAKKAASRESEPSVIDDVPMVMPALARAEKLTKRAAKVGFDWPDVPAVLAKVTEELDELQTATDDKARHEEMGDLLFAIANLARHLNIDPEAALRDANAKFTRRFHYVEDRARQDGIEMKEAGLERLDGYWNEIRAKDKT